MKKILKRMIYKCPPLRRSAVRVRDLVQSEKYLEKYAKPEATEKKRILFCSYSGRQFACSPKALYLWLENRQNPGKKVPAAQAADGAGLANQEGLSGEERYVFVWAFRHPEDFPQVAAAPDTEVVAYDSPAFYKELARCGFWVFNTRVPGCAVKKKDQVYVQTWHGTPLKKLGFDVTHYITGADDKKSLRYSYASDAKRYDVMLSPSPYYSEKMTSAFHLRELGKADCMLEKGYPRNDRLYTADADDKRKIREKLGISEEEKVILYAPTWREYALDPLHGSGFGNGLDFQLGLDLKKFLGQLGENVRVLLRTHYFITDQIDFSAYGDRLVNVSGYPDINDLYLISNLLITDYSSVFFDYAILEKPIVFYMYDLEKYRKIRDFYFPVTELPGPVITEEKALYPVVSEALTKGHVDLSDFNRKFNPHQGPVSGDVWNWVETHFCR